MLRAIPRPAWNSSKCWRPLSAPRRLRNAHFSPISSTAGGMEQDSAASLKASIPDVTRSAGKLPFLPLPDSDESTSGSKKIVASRNGLPYSVSNRNEQEDRDVPAAFRSFRSGARRGSGRRRDLLRQAGQPDDRALHRPRHHLELRSRGLPGRKRREPARGPLPGTGQARRPDRKLPRRRPRLQPRRARQMQQRGQGRRQSSSRRPIIPTGAATPPLPSVAAPSSFALAQ